MEKVTAYVKAHPWQTGFIAIIGVIVFVMIVRGGGGGDSGSVDSGPSDAEVAANATLEAARMNMQAQLQGAQIGAGVQLNSDNKAAEIALAQINAEKELGLGALAAQKDLTTAAINSQNARDAAFWGGIGQVKKKTRDDVIQAYYTGQPYYGGRGDSLGSQIGQAGSGIGSVLKGIGSIFSDQRLKENIVLVDTDAKGRNIYEFNYRGSNTRRRGFIAQDLLQTDPEVVYRDPVSGFMKVDTLRLN